METYRGEVRDCLEVFRNAVCAYADTGDREALGREAARAHQLESQADNVRREIESMMYAKAVFPESRGDILGLLESADRVPNRAESVLRNLYLEQIVIPADLAPDIKALTHLVFDCVEALLNSVKVLFSNYQQASEYNGQVDRLESEADHLEAKLIEQIFASDSRPASEKILLRQKVVAVSSIADRAEDTGDRIRIIIVKRHV